jgi:hypothetical protein
MILPCTQLPNVGSDIDCCQVVGPFRLTLSQLNEILSGFLLPDSEIEQISIHGQRGELFIKHYGAGKFPFVTRIDFSRIAPKQEGM